MDKHCENAKELATWLVKHPAVSKVFYTPACRNHPGHAVAKSK